MTYRGHIQDGHVVLDDQTDLPEGTLVHVLPVKRSRKTTGVPSQRDWRRTIGMFSGDSMMKKIDAAARRYRQTDRRRSRPVKRTTTSRKP